MKLPSSLTIIGVGGCGKTLLKEICGHEPIMQTYAQTGNYLSCFTIDTAKNEANDDRNWAAAMSAKYSAVRFEHYDLPSLAQIGSIPSMISENTREVLQLSEDEVWPLHDPARGIDFSYYRKTDPRVEKNFDTGVYRMRAVSNALFVQNSIRAHNQMTGILNRPAGSDVAIICGLGGGTGSGILIKLAQSIKQYSPNCRLWLFGLIVAESEGRDEKSNTSIILKDMENWRLTGETPFYNVILTPLQKTQFVDAKSSLDSVPVKDFSRAYPYLFESVFTNNNDEGIVRDSSGFCGFIHATARVISYPIDSIRTLEKDYDSYLSLLENSLTARTNLYTKVTGFIDKHETSVAFSDTEDFETAVDAASSVLNESIDHFRQYKREVEHLWSLLRQEIVVKLNLVLPRKIEEACHFYNLPEINRLTKLSELILFVQTLNTCLETGVERLNLTSKDIRLLNILSSYCDCLLHLGKYYVKTASIPEEQVRDYYMSLLRMNNNEVTAAVQLIQNEKAQALRSAASRKTEREGLRVKLEELEKEKNSYDTGKESIAARLEGKTELIRTLCTYQTLYTQMESFISEYIAHLNYKWQSFSDRVQTADTATNKKQKPECPPFIAKKDRYTAFPTMEATRYPTLLISEEEKEFVAALQLLDQCISDHFYWKYIKIYANRRRFGDGPKVDSRDVDKALVRSSASITDICKKLNCFSNGQLAFSYIPESEDNKGGIEFGDTSTILHLFENQRKIYGEDIIFPLLNSFGLENKVLDLLQKILTADATTIQGITTTICHHILAYLDDVNGWSKTSSEHNSRIAALQKEEEIDNKKAEYLVSLQKLFEDTGMLRQSAIELHARSTSANTEVSVSAVNVNPQRREFMSIVGNLNPNVLSQLTEEGSLAQLDNSPEGRAELDRIAEVIRERPTELIDTANLGIRMHTVPHTQNPARFWAFRETALVISTESAYLQNLLRENTNENINFIREIDQTINNQKRCHMVVQDGAKAWECGVAFIAAGNYLDNIQGFGPGGYLSTAYQQSCTNILQHTLMLEKGKILIRKPLSADEAVDLAYEERTAGLNNERRNAVRDRILSLYEVVDIRDIMRGEYIPPFGEQSGKKDGDS